MSAPASAVRIRRREEWLTAPRFDVIRATLERKRMVHPELAGVPTLEQLRAIAEREDIYLHTGNIRRTTVARASGFPGCMGISLRAGLSEGVQRVLLAHELGHCWLHLCDATVVAAYACDAGVRQQCEDEADWLAAELLELPFQIVEAVTRSTRERAA